MRFISNWRHKTKFLCLMFGILSNSEPIENHRAASFSIAWETFIYILLLFINLSLCVWELLNHAWQLFSKNWWIFGRNNNEKNIDVHLPKWNKTKERHIHSEKTFFLSEAHIKCTEELKQNGKICTFMYEQHLGMYYCHLILYLYCII